MRTVNNIRLAVLGKRHELGLSQAQVAMRAGVSRKWLSEFERGKAKSELGLVLRLLDSLDLEFSVEPKKAMPTPSENLASDIKPTTDSNGAMLLDLDKLLNEYRS